MKNPIKSLLGIFSSTAKGEQPVEPASRKNLKVRKQNDLPQSTTPRLGFLRGREWQR